MPLLPILMALLPLVPQLANEIRGWITVAQQGGKLTKAQQDEIHALSLRIEAEVQAMVARRAAEG